GSEGGRWKRSVMRPRQRPTLPRNGLESDAGYQHGRGERTGKVRPVPSHPRPQGPGVPPRKGHRVGVGGHALLVAARVFGIHFPLSPKTRQSPAEGFYDGRGFSPIGESWRRYRLAVDIM